MPRVHPLVRTAFATLGTVAPPVALAASVAAFRRVGPPTPVRSTDRPVHDRARRGELAVRGERVATYAWGDPAAPPVLVVHGWQSRASRLAAIVTDLEAAGFRPVAFDAPAHGDSSGRFTTILDFLEILQRLRDDTGEPQAVVGHSFGAFAGGIALHEGLGAHGFVGIASAARFDLLSDTFAATVGLPTSLYERLAGRIATAVFPDEPDPRRRFDLLARPAPAHVPALFVQDADDHEVSLGFARRLHAAHPSSRLVVTSGLGHNRVLDAPAVRAEILAHVVAAAPVTTGESRPGSRGRYHNHQQVS
ncbi:alpha/beta fold hydrolase [Antribacter gilvus]|uniref:alpha/beta fold hydrolase n=1 Tax=Antribacter gilvus TaxID=2304675 RepID=UPI000F7A4B87|nr:alpha/beta fold hydrolase [Antribacter gilvus]